MKDRLDELRKKAAIAEAYDQGGGAIDHSYVVINVDNLVDKLWKKSTDPTVNFMDAFFKEVSAIDKDIDSIAEKVDEIKRLHSEILSSPVQGDESKTKLDKLMVDIKQSFVKIKKRLKAIEAHIENQVANHKNADADASVNKRIMQTQLQTLSKRFVMALGEYNIAQVDYRDSCKKRIQRQLEIVGRKINDEEMEQMLESGNQGIFTQGLDMSYKNAKLMLNDVEARRDDIVKLEKSIQELHDLFVDMATLVEHQGELVDSIEHHVMSSTDYVAKGSKDTKQALILRNKARRKKIILSVICIVVIAVIILIIVISLCHSGCKL